MISITRNPNGSYTASAFVIDSRGEFLANLTFYGYPKRIVLKQFRQHLKDKNLKLSK